MPLFPDDGFKIPTVPKTALDDSDCLLGVDSTGILFKIAKSNLSAGLSSGSVGNNSVEHQLDFANSGDSKGLFYYLGTLKDTSNWVNPTTVGLVIAASSVENGTLASLVNRDDSEFFTTSQAGAWVSFHLPANSTLKCNYYSIKTRSNDTDYYPRNWVLQGSVDDTNWDDLDLQANNTSLNAPSQWLSLLVASTVAYPYFRLLQNGIDSSGVGYLCLGEIELYGEYNSIV